MRFTEARAAAAGLSLCAESLPWRLRISLEPEQYATGLQDTITIRRAASEDAQAILDCLRIAFEPYRSSYTAEAFIDTVLTQETVLHRLSSTCMFVAVTEAGKIVGTVAGAVIDGGEGHLRGMAVLPAWQGHGIAERLLRTAEADLAARRCPSRLLKNL